MCSEWPLRPRRVSLRPFSRLQASRQRGTGIPHVNYVDGSDSHPGRSLAGDLADVSRSSPGFVVHHMLLHLALNHSVLIETVRDHLGQLTGTRLSASRSVCTAICGFACLASFTGHLSMQPRRGGFPLRLVFLWLQVREADARLDDNPHQQACGPAAL